MKKIKTIALFILLFAGYFSFAQNSVKTEINYSDIQEIEKILDMQTKAWNEGDIEKFMEGYWNSDSLSFVGKSGVTKGWKATLERYKKTYPDKAAMGKLTFTLISKEKLGVENYLVIGKWHLRREKDEVGGHFSLIWKKIKGKWYIISDHTS